MMSFCPYITFTIVSLCQWNTIASYGKCLLVIRRCLKLYPVSMSVRCDIDLTVIFKSCRALYCLSIPIPFIMPNRLTGAPYLALGNYAIYAYLICLTHVPYIFNYTIFDFICQALFHYFLHKIHQIWYIISTAYMRKLTSQLQYQPQMNLGKIIE